MYELENLESESSCCLPPYCCKTGEEVWLGGWFPGFQGAASETSEYSPPIWGSALAWRFPQTYQENWLNESWQARLLSRLDDLWIKWSLKSNKVSGSKAVCQEVGVELGKCFRVDLGLGCGMMKVHQTKVNLNEHIDTNTIHWPC